jgi:hypothetical protein
MRDAVYQTVSRHIPEDSILQDPLTSASYTTQKTIFFKIYPLQQGAHPRRRYSSRSTHFSRVHIPEDDNLQDPRTSARCTSQKTVFFKIRILQQVDTTVTVVSTDC